MYPVGSLLRFERVKRGMTQAELSHRSGVDLAYINRLERGKRRGGVKVWKRLAEALEVEVVDFMPDPTNEQTA